MPRSQWDGGYDRPQWYQKIYEGVDVPLVANVLIGEMGDGVTQTLLVDPIVGALAVIDTQHYEVHVGETFQVSYKSPDAVPIADDGTIDLLITTKDKFCHLLFGIAAGGDAEVLFYEGVTVTADGVALTRHNMKRTSSIVADANAHHTPTITAFGALLYNDFLPGGNAGVSQGGVLRTNTEWILIPGIKYLIRGINRAGNAQPMSVMAQWYEETGD